MSRLHGTRRCGCINDLFNPFFKAGSLFMTDLGKFIFTGFCRRLLVVLNFLHKREIKGWRLTWGRIHHNNKMLSIIPYKHTLVPFTSTLPRQFAFTEARHRLARGRRTGESASACYLPVLFKIKRWRWRRSRARVVLSSFTPWVHHHVVAVRMLWWTPTVRIYIHTSCTMRQGLRWYVCVWNSWVKLVQALKLSEVQ